MLEKAEEEELNKGEKLKDKITNIEFDGISFSYNKSKKNIKDFSLEVANNEKIALIGKTGSRKKSYYQFVRAII